ncbi:hypothetical protein VE01_07510 [Pseudogymnoascus verrucosus]|uniref:Palmitoyl-protein thioesterase 1 n=1 Tax=Pseudogymnoascus verrucosus TaxID=342668 RepID=A0A1B8GGP1_9PEZI|nr:uncharacterized protein VE01_07510 [Pseudogymnoascus verrucosus]OBT94996.1 hypothetical protein VE01_07510 [Pseudogymnoascus verrucosus]
MFQLPTLLTLALGLASTTTALPATIDDDFITPLPLIIWHGLGDSFTSAGMQEIGSLASTIHPGTFIYNIHLDASAYGDQRATFFGNLTTQLEQVCADLASHPILSTAPAVDALGFSQGGQFLRAYVQRCNLPPVRSLVTFGSQHNGITQFQTCGPSDWLCKGANAILRGGAWSAFTQSRLVPAQYFRDPEDMENYLANSNFLADINNEREVKNEEYAANLRKLENFVMYMFDEDVTVVPKESAWFAEVNGTEVTPLKERSIYTENWLGLKELDEAGKLKFLTVEGGHMRLNDEVLNSTFGNFFGPEGRSFDHGKKQQGPEEL